MHKTAPPSTKLEKERGVVVPTREMEPRVCSRDTAQLILGHYGEHIFGRMALQRGALLIPGPKGGQNILRISENPMVQLRGLFPGSFL